MSGGALPDWYELVEAVCIALVLFLPLLWMWGRLDRASPRAAVVRRVVRLPGAAHVLLAVVGASLFFVVAEDVLDGGDQEVLVRMDRVARHEVGPLVARPAVRRIASGISQLTGFGLAGAVLAGVALLAALGRRREAAIIAAGTLSAWLLSAALKVAFAVPRPRAFHPLHAITGYGFPSAHAVLAVVGCGLLAWVIGRESTPPARRLLYVAAGTVAGLTGVARVLLGAHHVSDVIGGLAVGTVWLNLVLWLVGGPHAPDAAPSA